MGIARATLRDLHYEHADALRLTPESRLDRDLGLDSLSRVELFARIEEDLAVQLPDSLFDTAETLGDIAAALEKTPKTPTSAQRFAPELRAASTLASAPPATATTLQHVLRWHVEQHPTFPQVTIYGAEREEIITYESLWRDARAIASGLQQQRIQPRQPVALMLPTSRDYFGTFFGILLAGAVPVPLYPPARPSQIEEHVRRHTGILQNAMAGTLIVAPEMRRVATLMRLHTPSLRGITTVDDLRSSSAEASSIGSIREDSTALLQYTSGSTGQPKGVVLTHANVLSNIAALGSALAVRPSDVFVSWLPLYHDMGLIGAWLGSLYFGMRLIIMPPLTFLARPARWLEAIHKHRGTISTAPNFAYELCLKHMSDVELGALDLSSWRIALNGAEAVMPGTLARFQQRFARCGLRQSALTPVYGLAECSVGLTVPPLERGPLIDVIEREPFTQQGIATPAGPSAVNPVSFVSCGRPLTGHQVRVVDDAGRELAERREGRLEFRGPSATSGYYRNPEATGKLIRDGWLDSGDRAYIANGEVYVTGRIKDIIIRAGRHLYPDELEAAIGALPDVRKGCVTVFGNTDRTSGTERLIVVAETREERTEQRERLRAAIVATVVRTIGEPPDEVVLTAPHSVLKTSSGKIRRAANRERYESGGFGATPQRAAWLQLLRVAISAARVTSRHALSRTSRFFFGIYFWTAFVVLGSVTFVLTLLSMSAPAVWSIGHRAARLLLRVTGIRLTVVHSSAAEPVKGEAIVANHSSYLDGLMLLAAIRRPGRFVAKRELARAPIVGRFLRRLGVIFVERFQLRAGVEDANRIARWVADGESCIFFPEGTFVRAAGLMPFHLGAFSAAVKADCPIVPVALHGVRAVLGDGEWLPRRQPVVVHVGQPMVASHAHNAFTATIELRDAARRYILKHCGEPDLSHTPTSAAAPEPERWDLQQLDPSSAFASPAALSGCNRLSNDEKIDLLCRWYQDAIEIAVAEEEGMPGPDNDLVRQIVLSLEQLTRIDTHRGGPTKQHGVFPLGRG